MARTIVNICQPQIYPSTFTSEERVSLRNVNDNPPYPVEKCLHIKERGGVVPGDCVPRVNCFLL